MTLNIPDEAYEAADKAARSVLEPIAAGSDIYDATSDALRAAAPFIVAAELDSHADKLALEADKEFKYRKQLEKRNAPLWQREAADAAQDAYQVSANQLRACARQLRGGTQCPS